MRPNEERKKKKQKTPSVLPSGCWGQQWKASRFCHSLMSCHVLKAGLRAVVTLKEPAGELAQRFISVGAVEAGGLEFTLSSLRTPRYHYGRMSYKHGRLYCGVSRTPH